MPDEPVVGLAAAAILSLLPDLDVVPGILARKFADYHNSITHSLILAVPTGLCAGAVAGIRGYSVMNWAMFGTVCYALHVVMDFLMPGRGAMLFWPLTARRFRSPVPLFYGVRWNRSWASIEHVWTLLTELLFVGIMLGALLWLS